VLNPANLFFDLNMRPVSIPTVQQVGERTFYRRGGRWVDSRFMPEESRIEPKRTVMFGSPAYVALVSQLAREEQHRCLALDGDLLLLVAGQPVLVRGPAE
jgi:hypothetical protein